jgi:hypothetical protein
VYVTGYLLTHDLYIVITTEDNSDGSMAAATPTNNTGYYPYT